MSLFSKLKIKTKLGASIIAVFCVIFALIIPIFLLEFHGLLNREENERNTALHNSLLTSLQGQARTAADMANLLAQSDNIVAAMAQRDRDYLAENYIEIFSNLKKNHGFTQLHFHGPNNVTILRAHSPGNFDDDLTTRRPDVAQVNRTKEAYYGLSAGVSGIGLRGVVPAYHQGRHVGAIEFGVGFNENIVNEFKDHHQADVVFHLKNQDGFRVYVNTTVSHLNENELAAALVGDFLVKEISVNGDPKLISARVIRDGMDQPVGVIEIISDNQANVAALASIYKGMGVTGVLAIVLVIALLVYIARSVVAPILQGVHFAEEIAKGDFNMRLKMNRQDEIGTLAMSLDNMAENLSRNANLAEKIAEGNLNVEVQLASEKDQLGLALQAMVVNLNDILGQIQVAGDQIASGSGQVADSSQALSQGATESASSLEEISASLNQLSSQTGTNAENANTANQLAVEARNAAQQGSQKMQAMVDAMTEINAAGQNISKIIKVIDEIAFQTNLLALNAAVEAARAGQHGKGFAVVAEEVRNLAARSAKAAQETSELIEGSVQKTANGTTIADQTAAALQSIVNGIGKVTDLVAEIAAASSEQAQGVSQINQGITQIDHVTQQNTASAEESAAASEELSGQAAQLREMLMRFTLKGGSSSHSNVRPVAHKKAAAKNTGWGESPSPVQKKLASKNAIALDDDEFGKY